MKITEKQLNKLVKEDIKDQLNEQPKIPASVRKKMKIKKSQLNEYIKRAVKKSLNEAYEDVERYQNAYVDMVRKVLDQVAKNQETFDLSDRVQRNQLAYRIGSFLFNNAKKLPKQFNPVKESRSPGIPWQVLKDYRKARQEVVNLFSRVCHFSDHPKLQRDVDYVLQGLAKSAYIAGTVSAYDKTTKQESKKRQFKKKS